ncbi:MAG: M48 family metalloprotease [Pseudomonadota bacterium]
MRAARATSRIHGALAGLAGKPLRTALVAALVAAMAACGGSVSENIVSAGGLPGANRAPPQGPPITRSPEHEQLVETYGGQYNNPRIEAAVHRLVGRLVEASDEPNRSVRVTILNSPAINAFALPTGELFLTRGLITLANDESELAAVIAHELAHVTADHARLRQRQARAAALAKRVSDVVADPTMKLETRETAELSLAAFSQRQELEADAIGVRILAKAGFDPFAAARFLQSMARYAALPALTTASTDERGFLSSHPSTPARVAHAKRVARAAGAPGIGRTARQNYLATINGALYGDDPTQGYVRGREFAHIQLGIAFTVPEGYALKNTAAAVLATDGQHTAIRFDAVSVPRGESLPDYLRSGWVKGLIDESIRTTRVRGMDAAIGSALVDGWSFRVGVVRGPSEVYRFIFASSRPASAYEDAFRRTLASFRLLTPADRTAMRPYKVRIIEAKATDTVASLAAGMNGVDEALRVPLFETLNGLDGEERTLRPGMLVKIVSE